ncbi:hypothetical protein AX17_000922 [Amanita inopinata Kibby_2008]|nr:hypothetical protein AX17_000922 [Amanita inopinata Kibby_2008]
MKEIHQNTGVNVCPYPGCTTRIKRRSAFVDHLRKKHQLDIKPHDRRTAPANKRRPSHPRRAVAAERARSAQPEPPKMPASSQALPTFEMNDRRINESGYVGASSQTFSGSTQLINPALVQADNHQVNSSYAVNYDEPPPYYIFDNAIWQSASIASSMYTSDPPPDYYPYASQLGPAGFARYSSMPWCHGAPQLRTDSACDPYTYGFYSDLVLLGQNPTTSTVSLTCS